MADVSIECPFYGTKGEWGVGDGVQFDHPSPIGWPCRCWVGEQDSVTLSDLLDFVGELAKRVDSIETRLGFRIEPVTGEVEDPTW